MLGDQGQPLQEVPQQLGRTGVAWVRSEVMSFCGINILVHNTDTCGFPSSLVTVPEQTEPGATFYNCHN